jgi:hypothetical protein
VPLRHQIEATVDAFWCREVFQMMPFLAAVTASPSGEIHRRSTPLQHEPMDPFDAPHIQLHVSVSFRVKRRRNSPWPRL